MTYHTVEDVKTASMAGINVTQLPHIATDSPYVARFHIEHSAQNPFCPPAYGAITYSIDVGYIANSFQIIGSRRKFPSHEAYVRLSGGSPWQTALQLSPDWAGCLVSWVCKQETINKTSPYYEQRRHGS